MDKFNLREYLKNNPLLKEEKVFSVSLTNKDRDEELVVYVKGTNSEDEALKKVLASNKMKQYPEFTSHLETMDLDYEDYGLEDEEEEQFEGDLAFFDVEPLAENKTINEEVMVDVSLMMGADADKIPAKGKIPFSKFLPLFDKYWRTTGAEGGDSDFIAQGLENHIDKGILTDDDVNIAMDMFFGA